MNTDNELHLRYELEATCSNEEESSAAIEAIMFNTGEPGKVGQVFNNKRLTEAQLRVPPPETTDPHSNQDDQLRRFW